MVHCSGGYAFFFVKWLLGGEEGMLRWACRFYVVSDENGPRLILKTKRVHLCFLKGLISPQVLRPEWADATEVSEEYMTQLLRGYAHHVWLRGLWLKQTVFCPRLVES